MTTPASTHPGPVSLGAALHDTLASRPRPPRAGPAAASLAFARRALLRIKHVPEQLGDAIFIPVLFTVMFTYLFGGALAGSTGEYLQSLLPGTLVLSVLLITGFAASNINSDITSGVIDRFRSMPVWRPAYIVGGLLGDVVRNVLAATLVITLGLAMGFRPGGGAAGVALAVALLLVFAFGLSWVWTTLGMILRSPNSVTLASFFVQFPLTFASNVFVDPQTMPGWLRAFVEVNPVSHLVTAVRGLVHGTPDAGKIGLVLVAAAVLVAVFAPLTMRLYRSRT